MKDKEGNKITLDDMVDKVKKEGKHWGGTFSVLKMYS